MRLDVLLFLLLLPSATAPTPPRVEGRGNGGAPRSLATFLANINLENYLDLFIREEITMELLPMITESQFERIGVRTLGQRMRIVQSAQSINTDDEIIERVVDANEAPHEEIVQEEPETHPPNEHGVVDNNLEETRRGDEDPEFYFEFSVNGDNSTLDLISLTDISLKKTEELISSVTQKDAQAHSQQDTQALKRGRTIFLK